MDQAPVIVTIAYDCKSFETTEASQLLAGKPIRTPPSRPNQTFARGMVGWVLFAVLILALISLLWRSGPPARQSSPPPPAARATMLTRIAMGTAIIAATCFAGGFIGLSVARRSAERRWQGKRTFTFSAEGITNSRPGRRDFFAWKRFRGVCEGPHVLVLRMTENQGLIFPRRLFATTGEFQCVLALAQEKIATPAIALSVGFPVVQPCE